MKSNDGLGIKKALAEIFEDGVRIIKEIDFSVKREGNFFGNEDFYPRGAE